MYRSTYVCTYVPIMYICMYVMYVCMYQVCIKMCVYALFCLNMYRFVFMCYIYTRYLVYTWHQVWMYDGSMMDL